MFLARLSSPVFLLLAVAVVVLLAVWFRTRDRRCAWALAVAAGLLLIYSLYQLVRSETPGEQIERKTKEMAAAVKRKDMEAIFQHVSEEFKFGPFDKTAMRAYARQVTGNDELTDVEVWNFEPAKINPAKAGEKATATISFSMKPKGNNIPDGTMFRVVATFVQDADGQWRMQTFILYRFQSNEPFQIPQVPIG
jgi:ketosteroid isomerase-like protein